MTQVAGKIVLITGGNAGIGLGFARALGRAGAAVSIWGRSDERNQEALDSLRAEGVSAMALGVDVTDEPTVVGAMADTVAQFGRIDACFANAAGLGPASPSFVESTTREWRSTVSLVLDSV